MSREACHHPAVGAIDPCLQVEIDFYPMNLYRVLSPGGRGILARTHVSLRREVSELQKLDGPCSTEDVEGLLMALERIDNVLMTMDNAAPFLALHGEPIGEFAEVVACHSRALPRVINRPEFLPSLAEDRGVF